jgi:HK97 family phage major capsid protein
MPKSYFRTALLESSSTDLEAGIARLSFASEEPVLRKDKRGKFFEVLSHNPGDANLGLLNKEGVVLENHDDTREIGEVEKGSAKVDSDKKTRATIKIHSKSWRSEVRSKTSSIPVSVGYNLLSELSSEMGPEGIPTRRFSWQPFEVSLLTGEPADHSVGINRSKKRQCAECDGSGDCACVGDDGEGDKDCPECGGNGRCAECRGDGYFESARSKGVDLEKLTESEKSALRQKLMPEPIIVDETKVRANERELTATAERARSKEISIAADKFIEKHGKKNSGKAAEEIRKFANEAIEKGDAAQAFNSRCMEHVLNAEPETVDVRNLVPADEMAEFSVVRCIRQAIESREKGGRGLPDEKELEGQVIKTFGDACRKADGGMGFAPQGFVIPPYAPVGRANVTRQQARSEFRALQNRFGRDMQATVFGAGGATVPTYWLLPVIDLLRNKMVLPRLGVRTMGGLTGNVIIPRLEAPSTAYSLAEIAAVTASQETLGQVAMTPHRVSVQVPYSKQLVFQASPDIEALIRDDMMKVMALKHDELGINGQGAASEPLGILNTPGIGAVTFGGSATYANIVLFQTLIRQQNVMGKLAYTSTSTVKGKLKSTAVALTGATVVASGEQNALWHEDANSMGDEDGILNGCQAVDSQQIPLNLVMAGVFDNFIHGIFGGFDVVVDPYTKAGNAEWLVTMNTWIDYAVRHPQAFAISTDAGNQ